MISALSFKGNIGPGQEGKDRRGAPRQRKQRVVSAGGEGNLKMFDVARQ